MKSVCWHCGTHLIPPDPPYCEDTCPAYGECADPDCEEPGCNGEVFGETPAMTLAELGVWILDRISLVGGKSRLMAEEKFGLGQYDFMTCGKGGVKVETLERTLRRMGYRLVLSVEKIEGQ